MPHRESFLTLAGLLALHALFAWALTRAMRPPKADGEHLETVLQAVFVTTRKRAAPPTRASLRATMPGSLQGTAETARTTHSRVPVDERLIAADADDTRSSTPMQAMLSEQMAAAAARAAPVDIASTDLLADRQARLPGQAGGRFRMHDRLSPAQVMAMAGKLFGGMDARELRARICTRNRRNLVNAAGAADSPVLQVELETQRRYCNP